MLSTRWAYLDDLENDLGFDSDAPKEQVIKVRYFPLLEILKPGLRKNERPSEATDEEVAIIVDTFSGISGGEAFKWIPNPTNSEQQWNHFVNVKKSEVEGYMGKIAQALGDMPGYQGAWVDFIGMDQGADTEYSEEELDEIEEGDWDYLSKRSYHYEIHLNKL